MRVRELRWLLLVIAVLAVAVSASMEPVGTQADPKAGAARAAVLEVARPSVADPGLPPGIEDPTGRTRYSRTFEQEDGGEIVRVFQEPVNFERADGEMVPISNRLVDSSREGYAVTNEANAYRADLPDSATRPVRFAVGSDVVRFALRGADDASPRTAAGRVTYADVLPGVDVEYETLAEGLKETMVLADPAARSSFTFDLSASAGLRPRLVEDGSIEIVRGSKVVYGFAAPFLEDAAGATSDDVKVRLTEGADGWIVTLDAGEDWLAAPGRRYPVRLDPTVIYDWPAARIKEGPADTYLEQNAATTSHANEQTLKAGWTGTKGIRALARFDVASVIPWDSDVFSAQFGAYLKSNTTSAVTQLEARPVTSSFSEAATWNTKDGSALWATPGGDLHADTYAGTPITTVGKTYFWGIRKLAEDWIQRRLPDNGLALRTTETAGTTPTNVLSFDSANSSTSSRRPFIDLYGEVKHGVRSYYTFIAPGTGGSAIVARTPDQAPSVATNVGTGSLLLHAQDMAGADQDPVDLLADRFYNSTLKANQKHFGLGWEAGLSRLWLQPLPDGTLVFHAPSSVKYAFAPQADGTYSVVGDSDPATLVQSGDDYLVTLDSGATFEFDCIDCHIDAYTDPQGDRAELDYEGQDWPQTVTTAAGVTRFFYDTNDRIAKIRTPQGHEHRYEYNNGYLTRFIAHGGVTTYYEYNSNGYLSEIREPTGHTTRLTYAYSAVLDRRQVATMTVLSSPTAATGLTTTFAYASNRTTVTDSESQTSNFWFASDLRLQRILSLAAWSDSLRPDATLSWDWDRSAEQDDERFISHTYRWKKPNGTWSAWASTTDLVATLPAVTTDETVDVELQSQLEGGQILPIVHASVVVRDSPIDPDGADELDPDEPDETPQSGGSGDAEDCVDYVHEIEEEAVERDLAGNEISRSTTVRNACAPSAPSTMLVPPPSRYRACGEEKRPRSRYAVAFYEKIPIDYDKVFNNPATRYKFEISARTAYRNHAMFSQLEIFRRLPNDRKRTRIWIQRPAPNKPAAWYVHSSPHVVVGGWITFDLYVRYKPETVLVRIIRGPGVDTYVYRKGSRFKGNCLASAQ